MASIIWLFPVGAIRRFIFRFSPNQNFSRDREAKLLRKRIALVLQAKFEKRPWYQETDSMVVIIIVSIIVFTKQPSTERYLANLIFTNNFVNFQKVHKKAPVAKSYFSNVAGYYRSTHLRCSVKNGVFRKVLAKFTGKHLCHRLFF